MSVLYIGNRPLDSQFVCPAVLDFTTESHMWLKQYIRRLWEMEFGARAEYPYAVPMHRKK